MRKITNKKGYTLMEIVLVIAIIVIMLSAVSVGIAIDLNRYRENLDYLKEHPWEYQAVNKVRGLFGAPTPIPTASPTTEAAATTAPATEAAEETTAPAEETTTPAVESSAPAVETEKPSDPTTKPNSGSVTPNSGASINSSISGTTTNYSSAWGYGNAVVTLGPSVNISSANALVVTVSNFESAGTVSFNNVTYNVEPGKSYTFEIKNESNQWYSDPHFNYDSNSASWARNIGVQFNFGGSNGENYHHSFDMEVSTR